MEENTDSRFDGRFIYSSLSVTIKVKQWQEKMQKESKEKENNLFIFKKNLTQNNREYSNNVSCSSVFNNDFDIVMRQ